MTTTEPASTVTAADSWGGTEPRNRDPGGNDKLAHEARFQEHAVALCAVV